MKVLIAGATGALGVPLVRALIASGHQVLGITRTPGKSSVLTTLGAQPIVADVMDRENLLRAVSGQRADAVVHALTALPKNGPMRHRDMYQTDALRDVGTTHLLAAAREVGARKIVVESHAIGYGFGNWGDMLLTEDGLRAFRSATDRFTDQSRLLRSLVCCAAAVCHCRQEDRRSCPGFTLRMPLLP